MRAARRRDPTQFGRFMPVLVALLGAIAAAIGASSQSLPFPAAMVVVFLFLGLLTTWRARTMPLRGALFMLLLVAVVVGVVYGG